MGRPMQSESQIEAVRCRERQVEIASFSHTDSPLHPMCKNTLDDVPLFFKGQAVPLQCFLERRLRFVAGSEPCGRLFAV